MNELRLACRRLLKQPATTLAAVVTLAFSIGAAVATMSLLSAVLLRPLPVSDPDRLVVAGAVVMQGRDIGAVRNGFVYPFYAHVRESGVFERVAAQSTTLRPLLVSAGSFPAQSRVGFATHDFLDVLGVNVPLGRGFTAEDDRRGAAPVAILTDRYWRRAFAANASAIGRTITVADKAVTIVGVAARGFRGLDLAQAPDMYLPFHTIGDIASGSTTNFFAEPGHASSPSAMAMIVGRLRGEDSAKRVATRWTTLGPPEGRPALQYALIPINIAAVPALSREGMSRFAQLLAATVGLLLLIGCSTVSLLLLIRTEARRSEFATCLALGASRARLSRGVALEGALLAGAGAAFAMPVASWLFHGARAFQLPGGVAIELLDLSIDGRMLLAAAACALGATVVVAVIAGAFGFRGDFTDALRARTGITPRVTGRWTRAALIGGQIAVAVALLAGTALFARSLLTALNLNTDIDASHVVTGNINLRPHGYEPVRAAGFFDELTAQVRRHPAVHALAFSVPIGGMSSGGTILIDGEARQFPSSVSYVTVDASYFTTMAIPLIAGRGISADDGANAPLVAIVSESYGRQLANGGNPLGRRITMSSRRVGQPADVRTVVGVVGDVVTNVLVLEPLVMYYPMAQSPAAASRVLTVRAASDPGAVRSEVMSAIRQIDPAVTSEPMLTLEERIIRQMAAQHFGTLVLGSLGFIALLLTLLGTYVLAESTSASRTREMGIRAALGARSGELVRLVLADTGRLVTCGLAAGLVLVWLGASTIRAFLFGVQPLDPGTLAAVGALILVLAMTVSLRPALRASRVDLATVLRDE